MDSEASAVENTTDLVSLTADVVSAYLSSNGVQVAEVGELIESVHAALAKLGRPQEPAAPTYEPAVPVRKSITPDALISLIDGKPYRTLKRHRRAAKEKPAATGAGRVKRSAYMGSCDDAAAELVSLWCPWRPSLSP